MATKTEAPSLTIPTLPAFDAAAFEEAAAKVKELNDKVATSVRSAGLVSLDAYEKAVAGMVDFEEKAAKATGLDWMVSATATHASLVKELSGAYTKAVRDVLS